MTQEILNKAYYTGRASVDFGTKCEFTDEALRKAFYQGRRDVLAEDRLSADTEWDEEYE